MGKPEAVGSVTTWYAVNANGDPNESYDPNNSDGVQQYLISWKGNIFDMDTNFVEIFLYCGLEVRNVHCLLLASRNILLCCCQLFVLNSLYLCALICLVYFNRMVSSPQHLGK